MMLAMSDPDEKPPIFSAPPPPAGPRPRSTFEHVVPSENGDALLSYYLGLFSIFPLFGIILGAIAVAKGRQGLQRVEADPTMPGKTHARVGLGCGLCGLLLNLALIILLAAIILSPKAP